MINPNELVCTQVKWKAQSTIQGTTSTCDKEIWFIPYSNQIPFEINWSLQFLEIANTMLPLSRLWRTSTHLIHSDFQLINSVSFVYPTNHHWIAFVSYYDRSTFHMTSLSSSRYIHSSSVWLIHTFFSSTPFMDTAVSPSPSSIVTEELARSNFRTTIWFVYLSALSRSVLLFLL